MAVNSHGSEKRIKAECGANPRQRTSPAAVLLIVCADRREWKVVR
jgi:hypothetical protein